MISSTQHNTSRRPLLLVAALCLTQAVAPGSAWADDSLSVEVSVEPDVVELGKVFRYTINAAVEGREEIRVVQGPDVRPFSVVGRSQMPQFLIRNGVASRRTTLVYQLRARREGTITIKGPVLSVGEEMVQGKDLVIKVVPQGKAPKTKLLKSQKESAYLEATVTPARAPYVGEQMILEYALFVNTRKLTVQPQPPTEPSLNDFWIEELNEQIAGQRQLLRMGSRFMERTQLRRFALFPLRAGRTTIDSMKMDLATGGFFQNQRTITVQSKPITLDVKPLPQGAPDGFEEGNVGQWDLLVTTDAVQAKVGQPITLRVRVSGAGQANSLVLPQLPSNEAYRVIHSEERVTREPEGLTIKGSKTATYSLMPLKDGPLTLPALSFVFFDPSQEQYQTAQSAPVFIDVAQGQAPVEPHTKKVSATRQRSTNDDVLSSLRSKLREPKRAVDLTPQDAEHFSQTWWYRLLLAIPLLLLALWACAPRAHRLMTRSTPRRVRKTSLREALGLLKDAKDASTLDAYDATAAAIKLYLGAALEVPQGMLTAKELPSTLDRLGVEPERARALSDILKACTAARYASDAHAKPSPTKLIDDAADLLVQLDRAHTRGRVRTWQATLGLCLVGLSASAALGLVPAPAMAAEPTVESALKAQDAQQWPAAIAAWEHLLKTHGEASALLYNLGTASLHQGDMGRARWALETALLHKPADADIARNLEVAQRMVELKSMERARRADPRQDTTDVFWSWDIARRIPMGVLAVSLLVLAWLMAAGVLLYPKVRNESARDSLRVTLIIGGVMLVGLGGLWGWRQVVMSTVQPGVIMQEGTELKEGPSQLAAAKATPLVPGTRLGVEERREQWVKVRLSDEVTGWVPSASIQLIE